MLSLFYIIALSINAYFPSVNQVSIHRETNSSEFVRNHSHNAFLTHSSFEKLGLCKNSFKCSKNIGATCVWSSEYCTTSNICFLSSNVNKRCCVGAKHLSRAILVVLSLYVFSIFLLTDCRWINIYWDAFIIFCKYLSSHWSWFSGLLVLICIFHSSCTALELFTPSNTLARDNHLKSYTLRIIEWISEGVIPSAVKFFIPSSHGAISK